MLRINALKSASDYYTKSLTKGDYYSEQAEISGEWQGLGAEKLGLFGEIKKEQFGFLCNGNHPLTGEQLSSRIVTDRREAYDFTFSVPKSVSILSAVSSPEVATLIQDQITESVKFTIREVERNIQTRVRESGKNDNRVTENITYGYFLHKNARPINGYSDPHLHVHAVVMNMTFDSVDKKWKAIQMRDKYENREYYNSIFNSTLANRLQNIGLEIRKTPGDFDLAKITDQTIKTFSRRTNEIEKEALAQNIHNVDVKGKLGARTRQSKSDKHSQSELQTIYQKLLSPDQKEAIQSLTQNLENGIEIDKIRKLENLGFKQQQIVENTKLENSTSEVKTPKIVIIDADEFKMKFNDFTQSNHHIYGKMARDLYNSSLLDPEIKNVIFTSGGSGSGKSEILLNTILQSKFEGMVVDGTLADFDPAISSINKALANGKTVQIQGIIGDINVSFTHVKERELKTGRGVVLPVFLDKHLGFIKTYPKLIEYYKNNSSVQFSIVDARSLNKTITSDKNQILDLFSGLSYDRDKLQTELSKYEQPFNLTHNIGQPEPTTEITQRKSTANNQDTTTFGIDNGGNNQLPESQTQWNSIRSGMPQIPSGQNGRGLDGGNNSDNYNREGELFNLEQTNFDQINSIQTNSEQNIQIENNQTQKWLDYTLENHYERHSTSSEQRLIGEVLKNGIGQTSLGLVINLIEQYKKDGVLIDELSNNTVDLESIKARNNLSPAITTQVALLEEKNIIKLIDSSIRLHSPISVQYSDRIIHNKFLNQNQKEVISSIFTNSDGITLLEGKAGTGKTTTLKSIETGLNQAGYSITVLAPTTKAVEVLQLEGFEKAMTVKKYLVQSKAETLDNPNNNQPTKLTQYLIVDEASLVSVRQLSQLLDITSQNSQRVLLVGDTKQHKSVERGNILKTIQDYSQIRSYSLNKIQRQVQKDAKLAVEDLSNGKVTDGIEKFQKLGFVKEIEDDKTRLETVAILYIKNLPKVYTNKIKKEEIQTQVELPKENQQPKNLFQRIIANDLFGTKKEFEIQNQTKLTSEKLEYQKLNVQSPTLVITPTHKDGQDIHTAIRQELKANNLIDKEDHTIPTIRSLTWTNAQKSELSNYQPGQVMLFTNNISSFKKGERWEVIENKNINGSHESNKMIQNQQNQTIENIPTRNPSFFDVLQKQELVVSQGDLIQLQRQTYVQDKSGGQHKTTNGAIYQIKSINSKSGDLTLTNNWIIPKDFGTIKSAYYSTSHASQGQTVNHSIFYTSNQSLPLLNQEMVYVANSRFKQSNMILTPNLEEFKQQAQKGEVKNVAMSVVQSPEIQKMNSENIKSNVLDITIMKDTVTVQSQEFQSLKPVVKSQNRSMGR
jgi:conjugative relaxase-like TrwC/TraI family protein